MGRLIRDGWYVRAYPYGGGKPVEKWFRETEREEAAKECNNLKTNYINCYVRVTMEPRYLVVTDNAIWEKTR
jgi:hypothetical protein